VKTVLTLVLRRVILLVVVFSVAFLSMHFGRRTSWYKDHLYQNLIQGDSEQRLRAASLLAQVGGEGQLLAALKSDQPEVHSMARRALEHLWCYAAGSTAYRLLETAYAAAEKEHFEEARQSLDRLIARYPKYAEGWNRRAAVLWQLGRYQESLDDCQHALSLNPNHYGAWQGLGLCHLQMGALAEACRSLRVALTISPNDDATRRSLQKCEELLFTYPPAPIGKSTHSTDLL
jgi:tetratricopeptide (TPR) repeat protein